MVTGEATVPLFLPHRLAADLVLLGCGFPFPDDLVGPSPRGCPPGPAFGFPGPFLGGVSPPHPRIQRFLALEPGSGPPVDSEGFLVYHPRGNSPLRGASSGPPLARVSSPVFGTIVVPFPPAARSPAFAACSSPSRPRLPASAVRRGFRAAFVSLRCSALSPVPPGLAASPPVPPRTLLGSFAFLMPPPDCPVPVEGVRAPFRPLDSCLRPSRPFPPPCVVAPFGPLPPPSSFPVPHGVAGGRVSRLAYSPPPPRLVVSAVLVVGLQAPSLSVAVCPYGRLPAFTPCSPLVPPPPPCPVRVLLSFPTLLPLAFSSWRASSLLSSGAAFPPPLRPSASRPSAYLSRVSLALTSIPRCLPSGPPVLFPVCALSRHLTLGFAYLPFAPVPLLVF
uniref:Uncharacterized protein n=1 Tax=Knipowitschia caucasica TaxID=637954 RepID=A0AAV2LLQ5_KNICA